MVVVAGTLDPLTFIAEVAKELVETKKRVERKGVCIALFAACPRPGVDRRLNTSAVA